MKEVKLPSGSLLKIGEIPFSEAKDLFESVLIEFKKTPFSSQTDLASVLKEVLCFAYASSNVEKAMKVVFGRCLYNSGKGDFKIDDSCFEPVHTREDYVIVYQEVLEHTLAPFMKNLSVVFARLSELMSFSQKSK